MQSKSRSYTTVTISKRQQTRLQSFQVQFLSHLNFIQHRLVYKKRAYINNSQKDRQRRTIPTNTYLKHRKQNFLLPNQILPAVVMRPLPHSYKFTKEKHCDLKVIARTVELQITDEMTKFRDQGSYWKSVICPQFLCICAFD